MSGLAPWLQHQLTGLIHRPGHALLLQGASGLGQYELGLALAAAWLCHAPTSAGACGVCPSCHGIEVRAHADLSVLMPETDMLVLNWPLSEKAQKDIDDKKRKPSKEIRVEAMRDLLGFTQTTGANANGKVVLIYPAERMNTITANTLLKTLEEPAGRTRFILASAAAHELLPTVRSRCQVHPMQWPSMAEGLRLVAAPMTLKPCFNRAFRPKPGGLCPKLCSAATPACWPTTPRPWCCRVCKKSVTTCCTWPVVPRPGFLTPTICPNPAA